MAQRIYDNYISQYGNAPEKPKYLITFAKTSGIKINFKEARQIIIANANSVQKKQISKPIPSVTTRKFIDKTPSQVKAKTKTKTIAFRGNGHEPRNNNLQNMEWKESTVLKNKNIMAELDETLPPQNNFNTSKWILQDGKLYEELRNEWKIGSKCIMFSETFKQWIYTNIHKLSYEKDEQIVIVKDGDHEDDETISFESFSNNIQPIYVPDSKSNNISNEWINLLTSNDINNSLYVTQNLFNNKENQSRIKWNIGNILIIFD
eukprot:360366_1